MKEIVLEIGHSKTLNPLWKGYFILKKFNKKTTLAGDNLTKKQVKEIYREAKRDKINKVIFMFNDCVEDFNHKFPACGFCLDGDKIQQMRPMGYKLEEDGSCKHCNGIFDMKKWNNFHPEEKKNKLVEAKKF